MIFLAQIIIAVLSLTPMVFKYALETEFNRLIEFWAQSNGLFNNVSFTTAHLLRDVTAAVFLSSIKFRYCLNLVISAAKES